MMVRFRVLNLVNGHRYAATTKPTEAPDVQAHDCRDLLVWAPGLGGLGV